MPKPVEDKEKIEEKEPEFDVDAVVDQLLVNDKTKQDVTIPDVKPDIKKDDDNEDIKKDADKGDQRLQDFLDEQGFDSLEEAQEALLTGEALAKKLRGRDLDELIEAAEARSTKKPKRKPVRDTYNDSDDDDDPEGKIEALLDRIDELESEQQRSYRKAEDRIAEERALKRYSSNIHDELDKQDLPENSREILATLLGVDNPVNDVDITDSRAVKRVAKAMSKKFASYIAKVQEQAVKDFIKGKKDIPNVDPVKPAMEPDMKIPDLKTARKVMEAAAERMLRNT